MATRRTIIELTTVGGEKVKVDLEKIGESGQRALQRILDASKPANTGLQVIDSTVGELRGKFDQFARELGPVGNVLRSIGPAGLIAAGAAGGLAALVHSAIETASAIGETADKLGVGVERLQEYQFAARQTGVDQEKLTTALGIFTQRVGQARDGQGELVAGLKDHNRELLESIRNAGTVDEAFDLMTQAIAGAGDAADQAALANVAFGRSGRDVLLPFLLDGADGFERLREQAHEMGVVLSAETIQQAKEAGDKFTLLSDVVKIRLTAAVGDLIPLLGSGADALARFVAAGARLLAFDPSKGNPTGPLVERMQQLREEIKQTEDAFGGTTPQNQERLAALRQELETVRVEWEKLVKVQIAPVPADAPKPKLPPIVTAEEKAAQQKAIAERKQALDQLQAIEDQATKQGQTARQQVYAEQEIQLRKIDEAEQKGLKGSQEVADARLAVEEATQRKLTEITVDEQNKRNELDDKVAEIFADNEAKLTEIGATESEKRRAQFEEEKRKQIAAINDLFEARIAAERKAGGDVTDLLAEQTAAVQHAAEQQDAIWDKSQQHRRDVMFSFNEEIINGLNGVIEGILQGTRDGEQILEAFKDVGISILGKIFTKTLENKLAFDDQFKVNFLTDLPGLVQHGADAILGIFGNLFDAILGQKEGTLDRAFSGLFGGGGAGGINIPAGVVLGGGAAIGALGAGGGGGAGAFGSPGYGVLLSSGGPTAQEALAQLGVSSAGTPTFNSAAFFDKLGQNITTGIVSGLFGLGGGALGAKIGQALGGKTGGQVGGIVFGLLSAKFGPTLAGTLISTYAPTLAAGLPAYVSGALGISAAAPATAAAIPAGGAAASGGAAGGAAGASSLAYAPYAAVAVLGAIQSAVQGLATIQGKQSVLQGGANAVFDPLGLSGILGIKSPAEVLFPGPSKGQLSRRFIGNELLGERTTAIGGLGETLNFDPYKSGIVSVQKAAEAYPQLFSEAGNAVTTFGAALSASVESGQSDAKELNFIVSTLIDNFARAGVAGPEAIVRTAAAMKELHIDAETARVSIDQQFQENKISVEEYERAIAGLADVTRVTSAQMVTTLKAQLTPAATDVFNRMLSVGVDAFSAVTAAGKDSWVSIASSMTNDLLPRALAIYETLVSMGVTSAEAIGRAFEQAFNFEFPEGGAGINPGGQWFLGDSGRLVFGASDTTGHFVPLPAPETTPDEQNQLRGSGLPHIPGFAAGGIVPGSIGEPIQALVHGGEAVLSNRDFARLNLTLSDLSAAMRSLERGGQRIMVVPVVDRDQLPSTLDRLRRERRYIESEPYSVPGIRGSTAAQ